ncbi:MAG: GAF domain-containing protein [Anaerolineae bacterium]|nr:GAF domain-containing protein [Anaerolineae bacterium]
MPDVHVLAAIRPEAAERYERELAGQGLSAVKMVRSKAETRVALEDSTTRADVLVIDNELGGIFDFVRELRLTYPRLLIVLVDEDADFSMPGRADDVSTDPFDNHDLARRIQRLVQERQTETLRADALPPVRSVAKLLRQASGLVGKVDAAVEAIQAMGYDFVAYYRIMDEVAGDTRLTAAAGDKAITSIAPERQKATSVIGWVAHNGQSRVVGPEDEPNYSLVQRGRLGAGACVPVGSATPHGVLLACREQPGSISQENVMLLELVSAQLAAALAKEMSS